MFKFATLFMLLLLCSTISADGLYDSTPDDPDLVPRRTFPEFSGMVKPQLEYIRSNGYTNKQRSYHWYYNRYDEEMKKWCAIYNTHEKRDQYYKDKEEYDRAKQAFDLFESDTRIVALSKYIAKQPALMKEAENKQESVQKEIIKQEAAIQEIARRYASRKEKERKDVLRKKADTYFKPYNYNGTSPALLSEVRKLFWQLKSSFADSGYKEGQVLSDFFTKYGYIVADIDFPQNSSSTQVVSTQVVSTAPTSPKSTANSTSTSEITTTNKPSEESPESTPIPEVITSNQPTTNSTVDTQLPKKKKEHRMAGSDLIIAFASLIIVILLLAICLVVSLIIWLIKKCCNKEKTSNDESDDHLRPKKHESNTKKMDSFSVETPLSSKRIVKKQSLPSVNVNSKPAAKKDHSIVHVPETDVDLVWKNKQQYNPKNPASPKSNRRPPYIN